MSTAPATSPSQAQPAWEIAMLFPLQGQWTEGDYLALGRSTNRLVELADGQVEVLEMPTRSHQRIALGLADLIRAHCGKTIELVLAPYPVRLRNNRFREPDVVLVLKEHEHWLTEDYAQGADLLIEILSQDRKRDLVTKRAEYAAAGVSEYWIVDPAEGRMTVLALGDGRYTIHAEAGKGGSVSSRLLEGLEIAVDAGLAGGAS